MKSKEIKPFPYKVLGKHPGPPLRAFHDHSPSAFPATFLWSPCFSGLQTTVKNYKPQDALPASSGSQPMGGNIVRPRMGRGDN